MAVVRIFSYGGKNVVWPPYVFVQPGEVVIFKPVNTEGTVYLPRPEIFDVASAAVASTAGGIKLRVGGSSGVASIRIKSQGSAAVGSAVSTAVGIAPLVASPAPGVYPYSVYCKNANDFAEGNSSPVMIVEPPDPTVPIWDGTDTPQLEFTGVSIAVQQAKQIRPVTQLKQAE
jgi:hypothetical protein